MPYAPAGWLHWPDHPIPSQYLTRLLGSAQDGAGTISEIFQAASRIDPSDPASWHAAWRSVAKTNADRAESARSAATAARNHLRAAGYFRAAEQFQPLDGDHRRAALEASWRHTAHWAARQPFHIEKIEIELHLSAWWQPATTPHRPAVIAFGGLDAGKDELLPRMSAHARERDVNLLLVDLPGQGESLWRLGVTATANVETPVAACVTHLEKRAEVDPKTIVLWGASLGGVYAARAASKEHRLAAVISDGVIHDLPSALTARQADPTADWTLLQAVFGAPTPTEVIEATRELALAPHLPHIRCPYLVVQGEHDFLGLQTARDTVAAARQAGVPAELKMFTAEETGASHCQADNPTLGQEYIWDWLLQSVEQSGGR